MKHFFERQATATRSGPVVAETPATRRGDLIPLFFFGTLLVLLAPQCISSVCCFRLFDFCWNWENRIEPGTRRLSGTAGFPAPWE